MYLSFYKKLFQPVYIIPYLGIIPFLLIIIDINFIHLFDISLIKKFIIFYTLIIFSFVGAMRWNFSNNISAFKIIYGFLPSLISTMLIFLQLFAFNNNIIIIFIIFSLSSQLIIDFVISNFYRDEKIFFHYVRLPVTVIIMIFLCYLTFV